MTISKVPIPVLNVASLLLSVAIIVFGYSGANYFSNGEIFIVTAPVLMIASIVLIIFYGPHYGKLNNMGKVLRFAPLVLFIASFLVGGEISFTG